MPSAIGEASAFTENDEIETLWEIVQDADNRAAQQPGRPASEILFDAYEYHLARIAVPAAQRQKYFRFLLQFVATPARNEQGLSDRFIAIFEAAGIHIDRRSDEGSERGYDSDVIKRDPDVEQHCAREEIGNHGFVLRRSIQDHLTGNFGQRFSRPTQEHRRHGSQRSVSQPKWTGQAEGQEPAFRGRTSRRASFDEVRNLFRHSISRGSIQLPARDVRRGQERVPGNTETQRGNRGDTRSPSLEVSASLVEDTTQMDFADAFRHTQTLKHVRVYLRRWQEMAAVHRDHAQIAETLSRRSLLRSGMIHIGSALQRMEKLAAERTAVKAKDQDFAIHCVRAALAYDDRLKSRAITHWNSTADILIQDLRQKQQHCARRRCFLAWHELSLQQIQRQAYFKKRLLQSSFRHWMQRTQGLIERQLNTELAYARRLKATYAHRLLNEAFAGKIQHARSSRLAARILRHWRDYVAEVRQDMLTFCEMRTRRLAQRVLEKLRALVLKNTADRDKALHFRRRQVISTIFGAWRRAIQLKQRLLQLQRTTDNQLIRSAFLTWTKKSAEERSATTSYQHCQKTNGLLRLRLILRLHTLQTNIDSRVMSEMTYRWFITAQERRISRLKANNMKKMCLLDWADQARIRSTATAQAAESIETQRRTRRLNSVLRRMTEKVEFRARQDAIAYAFRRKCLLESSLHRFRGTMQTAHHLQERAEAARFYVLTCQALKTWHNASTERQRLRRREAYAALRRQHKTHLARSVLHHMRDALAASRTLHQAAAERREDHLLTEGSLWLSKWRSLANKRSQDVNIAARQRNETLLEPIFSKLQARAGQLIQMHEAASSFCLGGVERNAKLCLRRLDCRLFQVRGQQQWALSFERRSFEKHARTMLRYWLDCSITARTQELVKDLEHDIGGINIKRRDVELPGQSTNDPDSDTYVGGNTTVTKGTEPSYNPDAELLRHKSTDTPLPGYLRTPSKRVAALAKARERLVGLELSTPMFAEARQSQIEMVAPFNATPATAPATALANSPLPFRGVLPRTRNAITPFERKLRAQGYLLKQSSRSTFEAGTPLTVKRMNRKYGAARQNSDQFEEVAEDLEGRSGSQDGDDI